MIPSPVEKVARSRHVAQVRQDVRKCLPNMELEIFGSERTGLAFATSDIDLRLKPKDSGGQVIPTNMWTRKQLYSDLVFLHRRLKAFTKKYPLCELHHSRYPLIALKHRSTQLEIQIVLNNDTSLSRKYIQAYTVEYPYLPNIYSVFKCLFDVRGLSDVFNGGFGSYSIFMMTVAALRLNPPSQPTAALGLWSTLEFWRDVDLNSKGISIEPSEFFEKSSESVMSSKARVRLQVY
jgi:non-canonical poly(A) RNA polymerase PAPD5/7